MIWEKLTVADALSPGLTAGMITTSLVGFAAVLGMLAIVDYVLIARLIRRGPRRPRPRRRSRAARPRAVLLGVLAMELIWFAVFAVLLAGYFALEGFDLGVGLLLPVLGRTGEDRDRMVAAVAPFVLANEVWLVAVAGALVGAYPLLEGEVLFGLYPLVVGMLLAWVVRDAGLWFRRRIDGPAWRRFWDLMITARLAGAVVRLGGRAVRGGHRVRLVAAASAGAAAGRGGDAAVRLPRLDVPGLAGARVRGGPPGRGALCWARGCSPRSPP